MTKLLLCRRPLQAALVMGAVLGAALLVRVAAAADEAASTPETDPYYYTKTPTPEWLPKPVAVPNAEATAEAEMKTYTEVIPGSDITFDLVPIPGGKFSMGSPDAEADRSDDEGPVRNVEIEPFWMGKCEVTWDEYELWGLGLDKQRRELLKTPQTARDLLTDALAVPTKPYTDMTFGMGKRGFPAICMTQLAAKMYCKWLSAKTGRYYRLPTEAEWEYAARAGTGTAYSWGDSPDDAEDYAWHFDNSPDGYHKVGEKKPNPWGLYDMHGNVCEWVLDQYDEGYYAKCGDAKSPCLFATKEYPRVVRGGSYDDDLDRLRSAARRGSNRDWKMQDPQIPQSIWYLTDAPFVGFRVVRPLRVPTAEEAKQYEPNYEELREYFERQGGKM